MKHKLKRLLLMFLMVIAVTGSTGGLMQVDAITVIGSSSGGNSGGNTATGGYAVHASSDECVGYRFTVVNSAGAVQTESIDIYRSGSTYGATAYNSYAQYSTKCKSEWISCYSSLTSYTSVDTKSNYYLDSTISLTLPEPGSIKSYLETETYTSVILGRMGLTISGIGDGCMLIAEPLYSVKLAGTYYVMTVSDMGVYGYIYYDKSTTAPVDKSATDGTYAYVKRYTNNIYPNLLYTEDGKGLWTNATELSYTSRTNYTATTYQKLITYGYGVCIAYGTNSYIITYNSNNPTGGTSSTATQNVTYKSTWTTKSSSTFSYSNYSFVEWNTKADGTGQSYSASELQSAWTSTSRLTLYAIWKADEQVYTITLDSKLYSSSSSTSAKRSATSAGTTAIYEYYGNGFYSEKSTKTSIASITIPTLTGYTFGGYYTTKTGTGTQRITSVGVISTGNTTFTADTTLYAKWTANSYKVYYYRNYTSSESTKATQTVTYDSDWTSYSSTYYSRTGYTFVGWNTDRTATSSTTTGWYEPSTTSTWTQTSDLTLYAIWEPLVYAITLDSTGGVSFPATTAGTSAYYEKYGTGNYSNIDCTSVISSITIPTRSGYTFAGYYTGTAGSGIRYVTAAGAISATSTTFAANTTLYAKWTTTVTYYRNKTASDSTSASQTVTYGSSFTTKSESYWTYSGYYFVGWNTERDGSGEWYTASAGYDCPTDGSLTLYAQWTASTYNIIYMANNGTTDSETQTEDFPNEWTVQSNMFSYAGYTFVGWNTDPDATSDTEDGWYTVGDTHYAGCEDSTTISTSTSYSYTTAVTTKSSSWSTLKSETLTGGEASVCSLNTFISAAKDLASNSTSYTNALLYSGYSGGSSASNSSLPSATGLATVSGTNYAKSTGYTTSSTIFTNGTIFLMDTGTYTTGTVTTSSSKSSESSTSTNSSKTAMTSTDKTITTDVKSYVLTDVRPGFKTTAASTSDSGNVSYTIAYGTYTFQWNVQETTVTTKTTTTTYTLTSTGGVTLYAIWKPSTGTTTGMVYKVTLDPNLYISTAATTPTKYATTTGTEAIYVKYSTGFYSDASCETSMSWPITIPTLTGYTFGGYYSMQTGTGTQRIYSYGTLRSTYFTNTTFSSNTTLYAKWTANNYVVTYNANGGTGSDYEQTVTYDSEWTTYDGEAFSYTGKRLVGWSLTPAGSKVYSLGTSYGTWSNTETLTLYAVWVDVDYTISYDGNGADSGSVDAQTVTYGATWQAAANGFTRTGYSFVGWNTDPEAATAQYTAGSSYTYGTEGNTTLYAIWTANKYSVIYSSNYPSAGTSSSSSKLVTYGSTWTTAGAIFSCTGYTLTSWKDADGNEYGLEEEQDLWLSTTCLTLYAQWEASNNTVTYYANDGSNLHYSTTVTYGKSWTIRSSDYFTLLGHTFNTLVGWNTDPEGNGTWYAPDKVFTSWTGTSDLNLYAIWDADSYQVEYVSVWLVNSESDEDTEDVFAESVYQSVVYGNAWTTYPSTTFTRTGYTFTGWNTDIYGNEETYAPNTLQSIWERTLDLVLYAQWKANSYTLTYNSNAPLSSLNTKTASVSVVFDEEWTTYSATYYSYSGFTFIGWNTKVDGSGDWYEADTEQGRWSVASDVTLYAQWEANIYTIALDSNLYASSSATTATKSATSAGTAVIYEKYSYGFYSDSACTNAITDITVPTLTGYTFGGYYTTKTGTGTQRITSAGVISASNTTFTADRTLYAKWTANQYTVTYDMNNGSSTIKTQTVTYDSDWTTYGKVFQRVGYILTGWKDADGNEYGLSVAQGLWQSTEDLTLYAQWSVDIQLVAIEPNADYREATEVVSSFLLSTSSTDLVGDEEVLVRFTVTNDRTGTMIATETKPVICPGGYDTYVYFKWTVPEGMNGASVTVTAEACSDVDTIATDSLANSTCEYSTAYSPDSLYEELAPSDFTVSSSPVYSGQSISSASWYEWSYDSGSFKKESYGIVAQASIYSTRTSLGESYLSSLVSSAIIKSGYGIRSYGTSAVYYTSTDIPSTDAYTGIQFAYALFPEYGYSTDYMETFTDFTGGSSIALGIQNSSGTTVLFNLGLWHSSLNPVSYHYIPIWYPDDMEYVIAYYLTDCWTPSGMLYVAVNSLSFTVDGDLYDDWYIGRIS